MRLNAGPRDPAYVRHRDGPPTAVTAFRPGFRAELCGSGLFLHAELRHAGCEVATGYRWAPGMPFPNVSREPSQPGVTGGAAWRPAGDGSGGCHEPEAA